MSGPYGGAAQLYRDAGWEGVLPLPFRKKSPPPDGWTGRAGLWPSGADIQAWLDGPQAQGNIALRLPPNVIGLDVDAYGGKQGAATFAKCVELWGPLPPTWRSTSRENGQGAILLFTVPVGLVWPGEVGPGVEIIQYAHRYAAVWPSMHPEERRYRLVRPDGSEADRPPSPSELPALPDAWIAGITGGVSMPSAEHAGYDAAQVSDWLASHGEGMPCAQMQRAPDDYLPDRFDGASGRHDAALGASYRVVKLGAEGHSGTNVALERISAAFTGSVASDRTRPTDPHEWRRMVDGAVQRAAGGPVSTGDPCLTATASATAAHPARSLQTVRMSAVTPEDISWLWPGYLPLGKLVILDGDPATGKSALALDLIARASAGAPWPDGQPNGNPVNTVLLSAEDGLRDTIAPRLLAAGADMDRVDAITGVNVGAQLAAPTLPREFGLLEQFIAEQQARLAVVDVLAAYLGGEVDPHKDAQVRSLIMTPLSALTDRTGCTIVLLRHMRKSGGSPTHAGGGSIGIIGAARAGFIVARDPDDPDRRIFAVSKINIAAEPPSLAFRLPVIPGTQHVRLAWEGRVDISASALLAGSLGEDERSERDEAVEWLTSCLDEHGELPFKVLLGKARADGIAERTLRRARVRAGVIAERTGFGEGSVWKLPQVPPLDDHSGQNAAQPAPNPHSGHQISIPAIPATVSAPGRNGAEDAQPGQQSIPARGSDAGRNGRNEESVAGMDETGGSDAEPARPCAGCGQPLSWQRDTYGLTRCVPCEEQSQPREEPA